MEQKLLRESPCGEGPAGEAEGEKRLNGQEEGTGEAEKLEERRKTADVIIPVYRPKDSFKELLRRICAQEYPVRRIIIMNTEEAYWKREYEEIVPGLCGEGGESGRRSAPVMEVYHLSRDEFDHGGTRDRAVRMSDADVCILMTHDALPGNRKLVGNLVRALDSGENIAAAYARQLPFEDCSEVEKYTRSFNYPKESRIKSGEDLKTLGIKTYFCSNVCAAYDRAVYERLGGFIQKTIFNEDMIYAAKAVQSGYSIAYAADACVFHSHNYTAMEQLRRNFDLAVSQADHPEVFSGLSSEGEGFRLVKQTAAYLISRGKWALLPELVLHSGFKYLGYLLGKRYRHLPERLVLFLTMNRNYWS